MNPTTEQPPQPHRSSFSCDRHSDEQFTGFCPSCLTERLTILNPSTPPTTTKPQLRRSQSFSTSKNSPFPTTHLEPHRKSCDVRLKPPPIINTHQNNTITKTIKDHVDLHSQVKTPSWTHTLKSAKSIFTKKWQKWTHKQKTVTSATADYGLGRRSCDTEPPRFSLDQSFQQVTYHPQLSEVDQPGGSVQTKEYYNDTSSKRRKSLDRCNSINRIDSNAKVTPANVDYFRDAKLFEEEKKGMKKWSWNIWGFMHQRRSGGSNGNAENPRLFRSSSSVSWRRSNGIGRCESFGSGRKSSVEMYGPLNNRHLRL